MLFSGVKDLGYWLFAFPFVFSITSSSEPSLVSDGLL